MSVKIAWGKAIRDQRLEKGLTQRQLAEQIGVDQSAVSWWEIGKRAPSVELQVVIARVLGVSPRVLFQYPEPIAS